MSLISTTTPINAGQTWNSGSFTVPRAVNITGSVYGDQAGTLFIEQSGDNANWDNSTSYPIAALTGTGFQEPLLSTYFRIRFQNTSGTNQTVFRLYADARDPYGMFLQAAANPSPGGAYLVLYYDPNAAQYKVVNRFNGVDGFDVNGQAAINTNKSGKYASFLVTQAIVSTETVQPTSNHAPDVF